MVINYEFTGECGINKKSTIIYSPKRIIYAFFRAFTLYGKPTGKNIYKSLKTLIRTPNLLSGYDPKYSSCKTNCILALSNDVFIKEIGATLFSRKRFGSFKSIPNTYFAANTRKIVSYSICLKNCAPTNSSVKAAKGGYVAQLHFIGYGAYSLLLTDPIGNLEISFEEIKQQAIANNNSILKKISENKKSKTKLVNGIKVNYLTFCAEDVSFEYGLSEGFESIDEKELQESELLQNGVYVKVLNYSLDTN